MAMSYQATYCLLAVLTAAALPVHTKTAFGANYVDPQSYLHVINGISCTESSVGTTCQNSTAEQLASCSGCDQHHGAASEQLLQESSPSRSFHSEEISGFRLQRAPTNPARLQKPYLVCVSHWEPLVECTSEDGRMDFAGMKPYITDNIKTSKLLCNIALMLFIAEVAVNTTAIAHAHKAEAARVLPTTAVVAS